MKTETRMDQLLQRLEAFNELLELRAAEENEESKESEESAGKRGKKGGKGEKDGFFSVVGEIFFRRGENNRPRILGISHPSDGHPQEELTPDFGWFRPLAYNNPTWTLYWPELIV